ncbi:UNVERIFIED_CONTAM: hypothetical protein GTU68_008137 [Idotea baltica]|nr:hypothetical protein [Idotea baltica]
MAGLPVDPRLGRMVLAASDQGCLEEVLVIASALTVQDPRERPVEKQQQSDLSHARFRDEKSDFIAWLNLWTYFEEQRQSLSQNQLRKLCKKEFLAYMRMREWRDIHYQLTVACRQMKLQPRPILAVEVDYDAVHKALLAGLLSHIAQIQEDREYLGSRNRKLRIFPGSSQFKKPPKWIMAAEIVETTQVYARTVAAINPEWVLSINTDLLKHHYYEPRWQAREARVVATERISLYGLTVADKRVVHYGPINPVESRELLIREGLVAAKFHSPPTFLKHNQRLVRELEDIEARTRRRDILAHEQVIFDFYDQRLPAESYTGSRLKAWLKDHSSAEQGLRLGRDTLLARDLGGDEEQQFPNDLEWEGMRFKLQYQFEPGNAADGVSATVPVALLNRVPRLLFDWLVPGLLREKCIQLVKGLPKSKRKHLVPVPDFVDKALNELLPEDIALTRALGAKLSRMASITIEETDWRTDKLDDYYRMNIRVVDAQGKLLDQSRNLSQLIDQYRGETRESISAPGASSPVKKGLTRWDFGDIPTRWSFKQAGTEIVSYPGLVARGQTLDVEVFDYPALALQSHRLGVLRLARLHNGDQGKYLAKQLLKGNKFNLAVAGAGLDREALLKDMIDGAYMSALKIDANLPFDQRDFLQLLERGRAEVITTANEIETTVFNTLEALTALRRVMSKADSKTSKAVMEDVQKQLHQLLAEGFVRDTPADWFAQYPRYFKALVIRFERLSGQVVKDQRYIEQLSKAGDKFWQALESRPGLLQCSAEAVQYRWMLEEFRVSLFAQSLGTRQAISEKRLEAQWTKFATWLTENPH